MLTASPALHAATYATIENIESKTVSVRSERQNWDAKLVHRLYEALVSC
jgi:hypothetical protein